MRRDPSGRWQARRGRRLATRLPTADGRVTARLPLHRYHLQGGVSATRGEGRRTMDPRLLGTLAILTLALVPPSPVAAQDPSAASGQGFPNKPIRIIVGYSAGGGNDITARLLSVKMSE